MTNTGIMCALPVRVCMGLSEPFVTPSLSSHKGSAAKRSMRYPRRPRGSWSGSRDFRGRKSDVGESLL